MRYGRSELYGQAFRTFGIEGDLWRGNDCELLEAHTAATAVPMLSPDNLLRGITHLVRACLRKGRELQTGAGDAALEAAAMTTGACGARRPP